MGPPALGAAAWVQRVMARTRVSGLGRQLLAEVRGEALGRRRGRKRRHGRHTRRAAAGARGTGASRTTSAAETSAGSRSGRRGRATRGPLTTERGEQEGEDGPTAVLGCICQCLALGGRGRAAGEQQRSDREVAPIAANTSAWLSRAAASAPRESSSAATRR